jgi:hypothetical protein
MDKSRLTEAQQERLRALKARRRRENVTRALDHVAHYAVKFGLPEDEFLRIARDHFQLNKKAADDAGYVPP